MRALWPALWGKLRFLFFLGRLGERARRWWPPAAKPAPLHKTKRWPEEKTRMEDDQEGQVVCLDAGYQHRPSWSPAIPQGWEAGQGKRLAYSYNQCYNNPEAVKHGRHLLEGMWYLLA
jgi:hypothetical protein